MNKEYDEKLADYVIAKINDVSNRCKIDKKKIHGLLLKLAEVGPLGIEKQEFRKILDNQTEDKLEKGEFEKIIKRLGKEYILVDIKDILCLERKAYHYLVASGEKNIKLTEPPASCLMLAIMKGDAYPENDDYLNKIEGNN